MSRIFNFSLINNHPNNIEDFELDASDHIDSIYIGPQGELLEILEEFNAHYDTKLGVTKQFTLKPGAYDEIKKAYANWVLRWDMKPRGISSIFNRIRDYAWRFNNIKRELLELEDKLTLLKDSGLRWQDNTDDFDMELSKLKSNVINALDKSRELYPNIDMQIKILPVEVVPHHRRKFGGRVPFPEIVEDSNMNHILACSIRIKKPIMTVHSLEIDTNIKTYKFECEDIICCTGVHLLPLLSRLWGRTELSSTFVNNSRIPWHCEAAYLSPMQLNSHPYIQASTDAYAIELEENQAISAHVCFGNMEKEIRSSLMNLQIEAHLTYLVTWLTNYYIPQTQPLNRINKIHTYGINRQFYVWSKNVEAFKTDITPKSCDLNMTISSRAYNFARKARRSSYYSSLDFTIERGSLAYEQRMERYLNHVKEEDLPCNECDFNLNCDLESHIRLFLFNKQLTPLEEAYLGMFIEIDNVTRLVHSNEYDYHYVEEYIYHAFRSDIFEDYEALILGNDRIEKTSKSRTRTLPTPEEAEEILLENEDLTPEERTLRWATAAGGATNL